MKKKHRSAYGPFIGLQVIRTAGFNQRKDTLSGIEPPKPVS